MKGFALIEIVVTLFILSVGLLAIMGMQLTALRHSQAAYFHGLAITQLSAMLERLRFNQQDNYRIAELVRWNEMNVKLLPQAKGSYHCSGQCVVDLQWFFVKPERISLSATI